MAAKKINPNELGKMQAESINEMYKSFDDKQREAFLLGRISAMLILGTAFTDGANDAIRESEGVLREVRERLYGDKEAKKPKTRKTTKTTKKETKKDA